MGRSDAVSFQLSGDPPIEPKTVEKCILDAQHDTVASVQNEAEELRLSLSS
jgi:hypothetical protein